MNMCTETCPCYDDGVSGKMLYSNLDQQFLSNYGRQFYKDSSNSSGLIPFTWSENKEESFDNFL